MNLKLTCFAYAILMTQHRKLTVCIWSDNDRIFQRTTQDKKILDENLFCIFSQENIMRGYAFFIVLIFSLTLVSCQLIAPDPSSKEVQDLTLRLCKSTIQDYVIQGIAPKVLGMPAKTLAWAGYPELKYQAWADRYEEPVHGNKPDNPYNDVINAVDKIVEEFDFKLQNIRINKRDFSARRTDFSATLYLQSNLSLNLTAFTQFTTDQRIWVQIVSLDPPGSGLNY